MTRLSNLTIYLGRRGSGKSTLAAQDAERAAANNVMVVVHDELGGFPPNIGWRASTMAELKSAAASGDIVVVRGVDLEELIAWMKKISPGMPNGSLLIEDEGVLFTTNDSPEDLKRRLREVAATARHHKMRLAVVAQGSMLIDQVLVSQADEVALFGLVGGYERVKLLQCAVPEKVITQATILPDYQYMRGTPGRPWHEWTRFQTRTTLH